MDSVATIQYHHIKNNCLNTITNGSVDINNNTSSSSSSSSSSDLLNATSNSNCSSSSGSCSSINGNNNNNNNNSINENDLNNSYNDFTKTNLIVNYLPQQMTQDEIKQLFSTIGPVESCKLVKDKISAQSLGYAFVNFQKADDATKAINDLNGKRLQNKTIKVSYARPSSDTIKGANLYICGLRLEITQQELENLFTPFGTIISSKILTEPKSGSSKGVGFVRFDQRMEAEIAIEKLNGSIPEGNTEPITVKFANSPATAKTALGPPLAPYIPMPMCRGFYQPYRSTTQPSYRYSPISTYCTPDTTSIQLHQTIPTSLPTQTTINLANVLTAQMPTSATLSNFQTTQASNLNPAISTISSYINPVWPIFVYNIGPEIDENTLWQLFGPFGAVQSVKILRDQSFKCRGFGFVTMTNYDEAVLAIEHLNGYRIGNRVLQVSFKTK